MSIALEVPHPDDLADLAVTVEPSAQPWIASVTARADDGSRVTLTWDEIAGSVSVRWVDGDRERLVLERETASKVSVRGSEEGIQMHVWSSSEGVRGELVVRVGEGVAVRDVVLRA